MKLSIEKTLGDVAGDYPVGMNKRLLNLKRASAEAEKKVPNTIAAVQGYMADLLARHEVTYTQSYGAELSQVGTRPDVNVNRLRLGTVLCRARSLNGMQICPRKWRQISSLP